MLRAGLPRHKILFYDLPNLLLRLDVYKAFLITHCVISYIKNSTCLFRQALLSLRARLSCVHFFSSVFLFLYLCIYRGLPVTVHHKICYELCLDWNARLFNASLEQLRRNDRQPVP